MSVQSYEYVGLAVAAQSMRAARTAARRTPRTAMTIQMLRDISDTS
jgi:hypothetical protein